MKVVTAVTLNSGEKKKLENEIKEINQFFENTINIKEFEDKISKEVISSEKKIAEIKNLGLLVFKWFLMRNRLRDFNKKSEIIRRLIYPFL